MSDINIKYVNEFTLYGIFIALIGYFNLQSDIISYYLTWSFWILAFFISVNIKSDNNIVKNIIFFISILTFLSILSEKFYILNICLSLIGYTLIYDKYLLSYIDKFSHKFNLKRK